MPEIGGVTYGVEAFAHMRRLHDAVVAAREAGDGAEEDRLLSEAATIHEFHVHFPGLTWHDGGPSEGPSASPGSSAAEADGSPARRAHARSSDPWTSHAAARSLDDEILRDTQEAVLAAFGIWGPMCHDHLCGVYQRFYKDHGWPQQSVSGIRTRTSELVALGRLRDSGRVEELMSGRKSIIWEAT